MENPRQFIDKAFEMCAKARKEEENLCGHSWRLADYFTIVNIIYNKAHAAVRDKFVYEMSIDETFILVYNYAVFAKLQYEKGRLQLPELTEKKECTIKQIEIAENGIKDVLLERNLQYWNAWTRCDFRFFYDLIFVNIARIFNLRETMLTENDTDFDCIDFHIRDAFLDLAGYAILVLARLALDEEKARKGTNVLKASKSTLAR